MKKGFSFDNFYVYDGNRVAYLAAQKIVQFPGEIFNPFYVYSGTGLGKTHLLWAIHGELSKKYPSLFFTGKDFEKYIDETRDFSTLIIVDDIYTIAEKYQTVFLEFIDNFLTGGKQICFSGNIAPRDLKNFNPKLVSRLEGGLVCDIQPPKELALVDIIRKKSTEMGIIMPDDIALELAQLSAGSFRTIEGMVNRLVAYASLGNLSLDLSSIRIILKEFYPKGIYSPVSSLLEELKKNASEVLQEITEKVDMREEYKERIYIWEMKGFDMSSLKPLLDGDLDGLTAAYAGFIKKVERLIELQKIFGALDTESYPDEAMKIETMLFSPDKIADIESIIDKIAVKPQPPIEPEKVEAKLVEPEQVEMKLVEPEPVEAKPVEPEPVEAKPAEPGPVEIKPFELKRAEPSRTFDTLIIGQCNRVAYEFYRDSVLPNLGNKFNPFVLVGAKGTGKTHILEAIYNDIKHQGKKPYFIDLSSAVGMLQADPGKIDILLIDNFSNVYDLPDDVRNSYFKGIMNFIKQDREIILAMEKNSHEPKQIDDEKIVFELGIEVPLNAPSTDVLESYIRANLPGTWAEQVIKSGLPDFVSFYEMIEYINSLSPDQAAAIVEAKVPETVKVKAPEKPAVKGVEKTEVKAKKKGKAKDELVSLGLPGEEIPEDIKARSEEEVQEVPELVHDAVKKTPVEVVAPVVELKKEEVPVAAKEIQLKTVKEDRFIIPEITGELIEENY